MTGHIHYAILLNTADDVATALEETPAGTELVIRPGGSRHSILALEPIPIGHKVSLATIRAGEAVVKYGQTIGVATQHIPAGTHVHIHNTASQRGQCNRWQGSSP